MCSQSSIHFNMYVQKTRFDVICSELDRFFPAPRRTLFSVNNFTHLIQIILSAQGKDSVVNKVMGPIYRSGLNTPRKFYALGKEKIYDFIKKIGLGKKKAEYIHKTSEKLMREYHSCVPSDYEKLITLDGVGRKTALVYLSQIEKRNHFPVDRHVFRLCRRWDISPRDQLDEFFELHCRIFFKFRDLSKRHLQIVLYGRKYCKARHNLSSCYICALLLLYPR